MSKKKILYKIIIITSIIFIFFIIFFCAIKSKKIKVGNNSSNQEIIENILNISSYETIIELEINSNKNSNKYIIKQNYISPDKLKQEILEPENIKGIIINKEQDELRIENTKLNLSNIYNNYPYMTDNCIDLNTFINDYKIEGKQKYEENDNEIILEVEQNENPYTKYRRLYINKKTGKPTKMEINSNSKKRLIYILYKEVKFK